MNQKTAKRLRRLALIKNFSPKALKNLWLRTPRQLRHEFRQAMNQELLTR